MYEKMIEVLQTAIEKKSNPDEFPDDYLIPMRKEGNTCPRCGGKIKKIKVNNRGTYFCPECQPPQKK